MINADTLKIPDGIKLLDITVKEHYLPSGIKRELLGFTVTQDFYKHPRNQFTVEYAHFSERSE